MYLQIGYSTTREHSIAGRCSVPAHRHVCTRFHNTFVQPRRQIRMQAGDGDGPDEVTQQAEEERVEAFESRLRGGDSAGRKKKMNDSVSGNATMSAANRRAEWKKGQLFPEGWEEMDPIEKATELYLGERGILYWSTQLTIGGLVLLVVAWVGFRFIGPALGLYQLTNEPNF